MDYRPGTKLRGTVDFSSKVKRFTGPVCPYSPLTWALPTTLFLFLVLVLIIALKAQRFSRSLNLLESTDFL